MYKGTEAKVVQKINSQGRGWCFAAIHFTGLGSDASIRKALSNLQKKGVIRRLIQGVYEFPQIDSTLGLLPPDPSKVAQAIAVRNGVRIQASGAIAANQLGLSNQVPAKIVFLTDGPAKRLIIGNQMIVLKKATQKTMHAAGTKAGLIIQALKYIGADNIDEATQSKLANLLSGYDEDLFSDHISLAPSWMKTLLKAAWGAANSVDHNNAPDRTSAVFQKIIPHFFSLTTTGERPLRQRIKVMNQDRKASARPCSRQTSKTPTYA